MDAPLVLGTDHNLPYIFDSLAYRGHIEDDRTSVLLKHPQHREDELPMTQSVVNFDVLRGH